jgi:hypothetical protein
MWRVLVGVVVTIVLLCAMMVPGSAAQIDPTPTPTEDCSGGLSRVAVNSACISKVAVDAAPAEPTATVTPTPEPTATVTPTTEADTSGDTGDGSVAADQPPPVSDAEDAPEETSSPSANFAKQGDNGGGNPPPPIAASLTITVWQCLAPAFDPGNLEAVDTSGLPQLESEFSGCTANLTGVTYTIGAVGGGVTEKQAVSIGNPAKANFPSVWLGQNYITQQVPYNFKSTPVVICRSNLVTAQRFEPGSPTVNWTFQQNEAVTCDWYTYQAAAPGKIVIHMFECHWDTLDADNLADVQSKCTEDFNGYPFTVSSSAAGVNVNGGTSGGGLATFSGLLPGVYQIAQYDEGSFRHPAVYCRQTTPGDPNFPPLRLKTFIDAKGTIISVTLNGNSTVFCEWYVNKAGFTRQGIGGGLITGNIPTVKLEPAERQKPKETLQSGSVVINLHGCPAGVGAKGVDVTTLGTQCLDAVSGVVFTLSATGAKPLTATTSGDFASIATFNTVPAGAVAVSVTLPDGYAGSQVFCGASGGISRNGSSGGLTMVAGGGSLQLTVPAGGTLLCDWYAISGR